MPKQGPKGWGRHESEEVMLVRGNWLGKGPAVGGMGMVFRVWGIEELEVAGQQTWHCARQGDATDAWVRRLDLPWGFQTMSVSYTGKHGKNASQSPLARIC